MFKINSCCSYCGDKFPAGALWPITCQSCGNTNYLNPIPVVVLLVPVGNGLVVARRNIEPQIGALVLPGGYLDLVETWQEGAARELYEETGILVPVDEISLYDVRNGLDNTLVIGGLTTKQPRSCLQPFSSAETQEIALIEEPVELGFPLHDIWVRKYFAELAQDLRQAAKLYQSRKPETVTPVEAEAIPRNQHQQSEHLEKIHAILEQLPEEERAIYQRFGFGERAKIYKMVDYETDPVKMQAMIYTMIKAISEKKGCQA